MEQNGRILPRAAVVQDMSGFGKVSLTEAIPIMSAMGVEVCPLPTALLSTHTYEFKNYTLLDLTDEMEKIIAHWKAVGLGFDAVYSGYMSSARQIDITMDFMTGQKKDGAVVVVDPVMGDNVLLDAKTVYSDRMKELLSGMRSLCKIADAITPNLTEACLLIGCDYPDRPLNDSEIKDILKRLSELGSKMIIITSVMDGDESMCVAAYDTAADEAFKIDCGYVPRPFHGTGDVYTSVFTGALAMGENMRKAASLAADFVSEAIRRTIEYPQIPVRYGVLFEPVLRDGFFANEHIDRCVGIV